jgi:anti-sigma factor RsiW
MSFSVSEHELHLYVDGQLDPARRPIIEAYLRRHPQEAARVRSYQRQNALLRDLFSELGAVPSPAGTAKLARRIDWRLGPPRSPGVPARAAWMVLGLVIAAALGATGSEIYHGHAAAAELMRRFAEDAALARSLYADAVNPTEGGDDGALALKTMLDPRITVLPMPDLSQRGFILVGGRMLPSATGTEAQLLYRDKAGRPVALFVGQGNDPRPRGAASPASLFAWLDSDISFAVVGGLGADELRGIAEVAQQALVTPKAAAGTQFTGASGGWPIKSRER